MVLYYSKRTDVLEREEGRIMQDEKRAGQEIRKGDTLDIPDGVKHCLTEIQSIILRNDEIFAKKVLMRVINLEKTLHK